MKDLVPLHYFLRVEAKPCSGGTFLSRSKYASDILLKTKMMDCKLANTPLAQRHDLHNSTRDAVDAPFYQSIVEALQYLTLTRPNLSYWVQFMHQPNMSHFQEVKRILRNIKSTLDCGIWIISQSSLHLCLPNADGACCSVT